MEGGFEPGYPQLWVPEIEDVKGFRFSCLSQSDSLALPECLVVNGGLMLRT